MKDKSFGWQETANRTKRCVEEQRCPREHKNGRLRLEHTLSSWRFSVHTKHKPYLSIKKLAISVTTDSCHSFK